MDELSVCVNPGGEAVSKIEFTQYLRPDGRKQQTWAETSTEIALMAQSLKDLGCRFEAEVLTTGHVSLTIERDDAEGEIESLAIEVVPNGPEVPKAVDRLVETAWSATDHEHRE
jgi:hypothetical protein